MSGRIFISYRRDDSAGHAGRVKDRFEHEFGRDLVFMDVDSIDLGVNFVAELRQAVSKCEILLAVIGRNWLDIRNASGSRRLEDERDFVRIEIATALQRDIPIIPVLIDGASPPSADRLPEDLKELAERNAINVRHDSFHSDMDRLFKSIRRQLGGAKPPQPQPQPEPQLARKGLWRYAIAGLAAVAIGVVAFVWNSYRGGEGALLAAPEWDFEGATFIGRPIPFQWKFDRTAVAGKPMLYELAHAKDREFKQDVTLHSYVSTDHRDVPSSNATRSWRVRAVADTAESPKPPLSEWSVAREVTQYSSAFDRIREQGAVALYVSESDNQGIFKWVDNKGTRGFDLKLADAIRAELASGLGKPLKPVQATAVKWDTLLDRPRNGEADIVVASVTRKADRKQKHGIDFSESYFCTTYAFMYRASERDRALAEMLEGRTIGVQKDTTGADLAAALKRNKAFEIREYPNTETISRDIINARIDFAITDTPFAMAEELKYKNAGRNRVVYKEFGKDDFPASFPADLQFQEYVVVTRDGEDKLLSAVNTAIAKARRDGSLVRFLREAMAEFEESNGLVHNANDRSPGSGRPWECRR